MVWKQYDTFEWFLTQESIHHCNDFLLWKQTCHSVYHHITPINRKKWLFQQVPVFDFVDAPTYNVSN